MYDTTEGRSMMAVVSCPQVTCRGILTEIDDTNDPLVIAHGFDAVCSNCGGLYVLSGDERASVLGHTTRARRWRGYRGRSRK